MSTQTQTSMTIAQLCDEYDAWLKANNMPSMSADELEFELRHKIDWLRDFQVRWEKADH